MASYETEVVEDRVEIAIPADVRLQWRSRDMLPVTDTTDDDGIRHIVARMKPVTAQDPERNGVSETDFLPVFVATTQPNMEAIGAQDHRQSEGKTDVTPEIAALAQEIAGDRTGLDAARAIYDWVAVNIRYVAVYLDVNDGWIPHSATEVLHNGYGDCKDHVAIMQALLAARGSRPRRQPHRPANRRPYRLHSSQHPRRPPLSSRWCNPPDKLDKLDKKLRPPSSG